MEQKVWILENKDTGKPVKVGLETVAGYDVYAVGFATRRDLLTALDVVAVKDLEDDVRVKRVELKL